MKFLWFIGLALSALACQAAEETPATPALADQVLVQAKQAFVKKDAAKLSKLVASTQKHLLAQWPQFWELSLKLDEASAEQTTGLSKAVEAFRNRWPDSYVGERLLADWLIDLAKAEQWVEFERLQGQLKLDDKAVSCLRIMSRTLTPGQEVWAEWQGRDMESCDRMGLAAIDEGRLAAEYFWLKLEEYIVSNKSAAAMRLAQLDGKLDMSVVRLAWQSAKKYFAQHNRLPYLDYFALLRQAQLNREQLPALMKLYAKDLSPQQQSMIWGEAGRYAAAEFDSDALKWYGLAPLQVFSENSHQWRLRLLLRNVKWKDWLAAYEQLPTNLKPRWQYWYGRALAASGQTELAAVTWRAIASPLSYYGQLALDELNEPFAPVSSGRLPLPSLVQQWRSNREVLGVFQLLAQGAVLRNEGLQQWAYLLYKKSNDELRALAQVACEAQVWERCINASERMTEVDLQFRYVRPFAKDIFQAAQEHGIHPALLFALIRQESRFAPDIRSSVGAHGLMQLMPRTALWLAKKEGQKDFTLSQLSEPSVNVKLGSLYLQKLLERFRGSAALALAGYNAGPGRPARWRTGFDETAIFVENIPFNETRDYVQRVLSNAVMYAWLHDPKQTPSLKAWLGKLPTSTADIQDLP